MSKSVQPPRLLKTKAVGEQISRHPAVVVQMIYRGEFPNAIKTGKGNGTRFEVPQSDVDAYIARNRVGAVA